MEKRSFSSLISQIAEIYKDIKYYKYQAHISLQQSKMGEYRKHQAHIRYQKRKLYSLSQRVKDILNNPILEVKYIWGNETKTSIFSGLTQREISDYLHTCAMVKGIELKILEIKEIPTFN
jgi:hypothetical protein